MLLLGICTNSACSKRRKWAIMKQFYASPFFFDAFVLKNTNLLTVGMTEVFRQKDEDF